MIGRTPLFEGLRVELIGTAAESLRPEGRRGEVVGWDRATVCVRFDDGVVAWYSADELAVEGAVA